MKISYKQAKYLSFSIIISCLILLNRELFFKQSSVLFFSVTFTIFQLLLLIFGKSTTNNNIPGYFALSNKIVLFLIYVFCIIINVSPDYVLYNKNWVSGILFDLSGLVLPILVFYSIIKRKQNQSYIECASIISTLILLAYIIRLSVEYSILNSLKTAATSYLFFSLIPWIALSKLFHCKRGNIILYLGLTFLFIWMLRGGIRGGAVSVFMFMSTMLIWKKLIQKKWLFIIYFILNFLFILIFIPLYIEFNYADWSGYETVNELSRILTKGSIDTRVMIWSELLPIIKEELIFGHGFYLPSDAIMPINTIRDNLSAHNGILEILFRVGTLGLLIFTGILFCIWLIIWNNRKNWETQVAGAFIIACFYFMTFTTYLIFSQNMLLDILSWSLIAIGCRNVLKKENKLIHNKL